MPTRRRCAYIWAIMSIRSKPASRFQASCSSSIPNAAFDHVCALRQAPSPGCIHAGANMLPLNLIILRASCSLGKSWTMELSFTCVLAAQGYPHGCLQQSRFPDDTGSRGASPTGVSSPLTLSFAALSIAGVWAMVLTLRGSFESRGCSAQLSFRLSRGILLVPLQTLAFLG